MTGANISDEQPPVSTEPDLADYLYRRFREVAIALPDAQHANPERKEMPYKPQFGHVYYFGDPDVHNYDAAINVAGWWGYMEVFPSTDPKTGRWDLISSSVVEAEKIAMRKATAQSVPNLGTVTNYDVGTTPNNNELLTYDLTAGTITIGRAGLYSIDGYIEATGSNNQAYYGAYVAINGVGTFLIGSMQWDNNNPGMAFNGEFYANLAVNDVLTIQAFTSTGTLNVTRVQLIAQMEGVTSLLATI